MLFSTVLYGLLIGWLMAMVPLRGWRSAGLFGLWGLGLLSAGALLAFLPLMLLAGMASGIVARLAFERLLRERRS